MFSTTQHIKRMGAGLVWVLLSASFVACIVASGASVAHADETSPVKIKITCTKVVSTLGFGQDVERNFAVENKGTLPCYVRIQKPELTTVDLATNATISLDWAYTPNSSEWTDEGDYWYNARAIEPGSTTYFHSMLSVPASVSFGYDPERTEVTEHVVAHAVEAKKDDQPKLPGEGEDVTVVPPGTQTPIDKPTKLPPLPNKKPITNGAINVGQAADANKPAHVQAFDNPTLESSQAEVSTVTNTERKKSNSASQSSSLADTINPMSDAYNTAESGKAHSQSFGFWWIVLGAFLLIAAGGLFWFILAKRRKKDEEEEERA